MHHLSRESISAVLAGLLLAGCDKATVPAPEPASSAAEPAAPAAASAPLAQEVPKAPGAASSGAEQGCAPGGCAPGKCAAKK